MRRRAITASLAAAAIALIVILATRGHAPRPAPAKPAYSCTSVVSPGADLAGAIANAPAASTVCLARGSYPLIKLSNVSRTAYVTVRPAPGAVATVAGVDSSGVSFLRLQGLRLTAGVNFQDTGSVVSHDLQVIDDDIGHTEYGIVIFGKTAPIRNVLIHGNAIHDLDFSGSSSGYAGGQGVTVYYGAGVTVAGNTFWANSWHYIQCGGCDDVTVDHNLFQGPSNQHAGAHLNVWEIWQGGANDAFTNNIVRGAPGAPIANNAILWESGAGGRTPSDTYSNMTIANNLFVNEDESYAIQTYAARGLRITDNTIVGSTYGLLAGRVSPGGSPGRDYDISRNIVVGNLGTAPGFSIGPCTANCTYENNVSADGSAAAIPGAQRFVVHWTPRWSSRAGFAPLGLPFDAGYRGGGGP